jgi:hypothetical protein
MYAMADCNTVHVVVKAETYFFPVLVDYENRSVGHRNSIYSTNQVLDAIEISSSVS